MKTTIELTSEPLRVENESLVMPPDVQQAIQALNQPAPGCPQIADVLRARGESLPE